MSLNLGFCCCDPPCEGCLCDSLSSVQLDAVYGDGSCGDCSIFDSVVLPKVANFTTLPGGLGDTCKSTSCGNPCAIPGVGTAPICYYQSEEELECGEGNPTYLRFRVSIAQKAEDLSKLIVMVSVVLVRATFFTIIGDLQARTGCGLWTLGLCDDIDMDIELNEVCIEGSASKACILPDTVHITIV